MISTSVSYSHTYIPQIKPLHTGTYYLRITIVLDRWHVPDWITNNAENNAGR